MNMIQKIFPCVIPVFMPEGLNDTVREYQVSAWMAEGSNTVNLRLRDGMGWFEFTDIQVERLSDYAHLGIKNMDELVSHLFWVVPA